jgi:putative glutamine amidotransferase
MSQHASNRVALSFGDPAKLKPYENALSAVSLEPVFNPESLEDVSGLVLAGGTDVDPQLYGQVKAPETQEPDRDRDAREQRLIVEAIERDLPVLAICRGLQMLNVALGGTLLQHLANANDHARRTPDPSERVHDVVLSGSALLNRGTSEETYAVNSRHHQAIATPASQLRVIAVSPRDRVIEAVEMPGRRFVLGVQWHPEDRIGCDFDRRLFEAFARSVVTL